MKYVAYGCDGYAGGIRPDVEVIHCISMFDINLENLIKTYITNQFEVDQHETIDEEGDKWITTLYSDEWIKVDYVAADAGVHETCL